MDRLSQLRDEAGGSGDSTLDTTTSPSEAFMSANENSSKYFSINDTLDITPIRDVSLASTSAEADRSEADNDELISNLSPIGKDKLDSFEIGKQIEAANILSGGVDIFEDNSFDGDELVIDDNVEPENRPDIQAEILPVDEVEPDPELEPEPDPEFEAEPDPEPELEPQPEPAPAPIEQPVNAANIQMEVVLHIDGNNVNAIDIGNGLYLYRKLGQDELAAIQIIDGNPQHSFKFLKVRDNPEGNLEVYEEIEIEVPKEVPTKEGTSGSKNAPHVPTVDIKKSISDFSASNKVDGKTKSPQNEPVPGTSKDYKNAEVSEISSEVNANGKMMKFSESRKSPLVGSFTPMTFHSTPNKEGKPLTKTMIDLQLDPNRHSDNVKKTIEVHTDNIKPKSTDFLEKDKDLAENAKSDEVVQAAKDLLIEKNENQEIEKKVSINENEEKQAAAKCTENSAKMPKSEIDTNKDENIVKKSGIKVENKDVVGSSYSKYSNKDEAKADVTDIPILEKIDTPKESQQHLKVVSKLNAIVPVGSSIFIDENNVEELTVTAETNDITKIMSKPEVEQPKPVDNYTKPDLEFNKDTEKLVENKCELIGSMVHQPSTSKDSGNVQNTTTSSVQNVTDKQSKTAQVEQAPLNNIPNTSNVKLIANKVEPVNNSFKASEEIVKFPLESFSDVSSTCSRLGNEESKEESITLYSIDTDESVSLITPSSTTSANKNEVVLNDNISEVLTTLRNLSDIQTEETDNIEKEITVQVVKESTNPVNEESKKTNQKNPKETICTLMPVPESKLATKVVPSTLMPKLPVSKLDKSVVSTLKPKLPPYELNKQNASEKAAILQDDLTKPRLMAPKSELMPLEKPAVSDKVPEKNLADKIYHIPLSNPSEKVSPTTVYAAVKQPHISSTALVKTAKHESHIPIVSIASKPAPKHISAVALKHEVTTKPKNGANQKESSKNKITAENPIVTKIEIKGPVKNSKIDLNPVNNNHTIAVPFGKWTDANRQEFLNKFKEVKVPIHTNSKQIKNSNDLNRRDVLQKIDSQRAQTISNANAKSQEKAIVKTENVFSSKPLVDAKILTITEIVDNKPKQVSKKVTMKQESSMKTAISSSVPPTSVTNVNVEAVSKHKPVAREQSFANKQEYIATDKSSIGKLEPVLKHQNPVGKTETDPKEQNTASCYMASLIDRTIEDMITRVAPGKNSEEFKQTVTKTSELDHNAHKTAVNPETPKPVVSLDDIEKKMNELHGIPFVERPSHELPMIPKTEIKGYSKNEKLKSLPNDSKSNNIPNIPKLLKDADSDDEAIEHEPITGDVDLNKKKAPIKTHSQNKNLLAKTKGESADKNESKRGSEIITETDFDKFARRNSITYENCLTVNFDHTEQHSIIHTVKQTDHAPKLNLKRESIRSEVKSKLPNIPSKRRDVHEDKTQGAINSNNTEGCSNKKYQSKIHSAYQSAITAKNQVSRPIGIIEDKPVKVVFMESSMGFVPSQLNVQGQELSPAKTSAVEVNCTASATDNDSMDSIMLEDNDIQYNKCYVATDVVTKTKHQRKQVLTPVETPDLELIQPSDIGIENPAKKKRKLEDVKAKTLAPKKSYLLNRNITTEGNIANDQPLLKHSPVDGKHTEEAQEHKDTASAIDNLVKAAEMLENQEEIVNRIQNPDTQPNTPVKRGRGRPRKYPLPDETVDNKTPSPQKKPRLVDDKPVKQSSISDEHYDNSSEEEMVRENWTMGKINENIVCPICNKLFRSENVVFKHVKHCTGVSPNRSDSEKRSPRRRRLSQESDCDDFEMSSTESKTESSEKRTSKRSIKIESKSDLNKEDIIVIEDTPIKERSAKPINDNNEDELKKEATLKVSHQNKSLVCEFCGKTFRQQSYLASHKLQHKKDMSKKQERNIQDSNKSEVFSCEVCKKEFRKLHHLVQHRINHNPDSAPKRTLRKNSSEQNDNKNVKNDVVVKETEDASAGFRCEPCDKSFRKLHHLVEHRGTHDGINRQKPASQTTIDKPSPPPQCEICKKTFRKLHHLIEHKEQHMDTNSDKSDDKSIKSALSTKDIIHECSLCYMVFPNEHSLNKHSVICSRKKRQSKHLKETAANGSDKNDEATTANENKADKDVSLSENDAKDIVCIENSPKPQNSEEIKKPPEKDTIVDVEKPFVAVITQTITEKIDVDKEANKTKESEAKVIELNATATADPVQSAINKFSEKVDIDKSKKIDLKEIKTQDIQKKKNVLKHKNTSPNVTKRPKSIEVPPMTASEKNKPVESSDDDEVRYMFNPNFKVEQTAEGKTFMKVRARKRNSLQIERPNSNDHAKRRTSLQHPPKIARLKPKAVEIKPKSVESKPKKAGELKFKGLESNDKPMAIKPKTEENKSLSVQPNKLKHLPKLNAAEAALSTDSDDSDVKYSFPKTALEASKPSTHKEIEKKLPRKSLAEKRKSLSGVAKRKSLGKAVTVKHKENSTVPKPIKKRWAVVEHRCDCGQLFSSAALLSRHTSLAHTPPRIRRRRSPPPDTALQPPRLKGKPTPAPANKPSDNAAKTTPTRKSSAKKTDLKLTKSNKPTRSTRRSNVHAGVPVPEKMRKL